MAGFFTDPETSSLHDYLVGEVEREVLSGDVKLGLTGAWQVDTWDDLGGSQGYVFTLKLTHQRADTPGDRQFGVAGRGFSVTRPDRNLFGRWKDQIYVRAPSL